MRSKCILFAETGFLFAIMGCSSSGGSATRPLDLQTVEFSLEHILQRRIHTNMWMAAVQEALENPWRALKDTPPPPDPCIDIVTVAGDLAKGYAFRIRATQCVDFAGVTRVVSGEVTFTGDPFAKERYTGSYEGVLVIQWSADPDGGRSVEAAMLNADAAKVTVKGTWDIGTSLTGTISGEIYYAKGKVIHRDNID